MTQRNTDVIVLGAGIVGISAALHLQQRGREVVVVDRQPPGEGTSYGNAGLIENASVFPYMFPRDLRHLLRYAFNRSAEVHYQLRGIPEFLPWLARYFIASSPRASLRSAMAALPLIQRSLVEHEALIRQAEVPELLRRTGWIKLFRSDATLDRALAELEAARALGVDANVLDPAAIAAREPNLTGAFRRRDPLAVARLRSRSRRTGEGLCRTVVPSRRTAGPGRCDEPASRMAPDGASRPQTEARSSGARPWSRSARGRTWCSGRSATAFRSASSAATIMHLKPRGNAVLQHPVLDADRGFLLAPMDRGIRLTTGAEFARRDAPPSPVQIERTLPLARELFPLGDAIEPDAVDGRAAVPAGHAAGDRAGAASSGAVVRLRSSAPRPDARACDRPAARRNDDRRDAVRRSKAVCGGAVRLIAAVAALASPLRSRRY